MGGCLEIRVSPTRPELNYIFKRIWTVKIVHSGETYDEVHFTDQCKPVYCQSVPLVTEQN